MTDRTETETFAPGDGVSAMFYEVEQRGKGATVAVERTPERGWTSTATFPADDSPRARFYDVLLSRGFTGWHTGGGCMAMGRNIGEGANAWHILVTDADADMPEPDTLFWVGLYDPDGDFDVDIEAEGTGAEALAAALDRVIAKGEALMAAETPELRAKREADHAAMMASLHPSSAA